MSGIVGTNSGRSSGKVGSTAVGADSITGSEIADDVLDSEHYVAASIDNEHLADDAVGTDEIADNAVTLAKMAGGTDGNIISFDASANPVYIATGSDGQVLTSTGAGSPPAFEDAGGGGLVLQMRYTVNSAYSATTGIALPFDNSIPQISQGTSAAIDVAITPAHASNILVIQGTVNAAHSASGDMNSALFQDSTAGALAAWKIESSYATGNHFDVNHIFYVMAAGTTSATTFRVRMGPPSGTGTMYINGGQSSGRKYGGVSRTILTVTELSPNP